MQTSLKYGFRQNITETRKLKWCDTHSLKLFSARVALEWSGVKFQAARWHRKVSFENSAVRSGIIDSKKVWVNDFQLDCTTSPFNSGQLGQTRHQVFRVTKFSHHINAQYLKSFCAVIS